jgi:[acyl-carrier-protein] S-malonyltransferase
MSKTAFVFPGQGAQYVGMGKDFFDQFEIAKSIYLKANDVLGFDLMKISFEGPEDSLKQTRVTQPAIFVHSVVALEVVRHLKGPSFAPCQMVAGHSLGEYSALVAAGFMTFEDALKVVKVRAEGMQKAGEAQKGTMAAIMGLDKDILVAICQEASAKGIVQCANFNSPGQIVISGSVEGVQAAMAIAKERGARMVKELIVSGAFHSPLMAPARQAVADILNNTSVNNSQIPVYANVTSQANTDGSMVKNQLVEQITSAVRWQESIVNMIADGATKFYEFGPGNVLQGLIKRIDKNIVCECIGKADDLNKI